MTSSDADRVAAERVPFPREEGDAGGFLELADDLLTDTVATYAPGEIYLVRIDNWFDWKWRGFQGKTIGALGVWSYGRLVIPPFHPNRVIRQRHLVKLADGSYEDDGTGRPLHIKIPSQQALQRWVEKLAPATVLAWIGGGSESAGRGSAMIYAAKPFPEDGIKYGVWSSWYTSFVRTGEAWELDRTSGLSKPEVRAMLTQGAASRV